MIEIKRTEQEDQGIFTAYDDDVKAGIMTYTRIDNQSISIDHTETFPGHKGKGIGMKLVKAGIAFAEKEGLHIIPVCSFARKVIEKKEKHQD